MNMAPLNEKNGMSNLPSLRGRYREFDQHSRRRLRDHNSTIAEGKERNFKFLKSFSDFGSVTLRTPVRLDLVRLLVKIISQKKSNYAVKSHNQVQEVPHGHCDKPGEPGQPRGPQPEHVRKEERRQTC